MTYETMVSGYLVLPKGEPIYSEQATMIQLEDEAAGLFVVVKQCPNTGEQKISFTHEEWPQIRQAIDRLIKVCRDKDEVQP